MIRIRINFFTCALFSAFIGLIRGIFTGSLFKAETTALLTMAIVSLIVALLNVIFSRLAGEAEKAERQ